MKNYTYTHWLLIKCCTAKSYQMSGKFFSWLTTIGYFFVDIKKLVWMVRDNPGIIKKHSRNKLKAALFTVDISRLDWEASKLIPVSSSKVCSWLHRQRKKKLLKESVMVSMTKVIWLQWYMKHSDGSIMIWGCFAQSGWINEGKKLKVKKTLTLN